MRTAGTWNPRRPMVPVDKDGNWLAFPERYAFWEPVRPFYAELTIDGVETGRSTKRVILRDANGKKYPMFVADLVKGIQRGLFEVHSGVGDETGTLVAWWTAAKRGDNYGIAATNELIHDWDDV